MTRIKICGIQEPAEGLAARQAGADLVGVVFVPRRRRRVDVARAREIVAALRDGAQSPPLAVGLFADQPIYEVNQTLGLCGLDMAQLCGQESADYCGRVEAPVIKVVHVRPSLDVGEAVDSLARELELLTGLGHRVTLDRMVEGLQGGTGEAFDWEIARQLSDRGHSFLLAGGLTPHNVAEAVRTTRPWGVDVSSGVESGGRKDPGKIDAFIAAVRAASK